MILTPGIYRGIPHADYRAIQALNWSSLKHMADSPKHYRHELSRQRESTPAQLSGTRFHTALLEPARFDDAYVVLPDDAPRRPTAAQWSAKKPSPDSLAAMAWWSEFNDRNACKEVIEAHEYATALTMASAVRSDPVASRYMAAAEEIELTVIWVDPLTGLLCKARPDIVARRPGGGRVLLDPKSCRPSDPRLFGQRAAAFGYHCQLAHYRNGLAENGIEVEACGLISCESLPPHDVGVHWLDESTQALAQETLEALLTRVRACHVSDNWPGRYETEQTLRVPEYLFANEMELSYAD